MKKERADKVSTMGLDDEPVVYILSQCQKKKQKIYREVDIFYIDVNDNIRHSNQRHLSYKQLHAFSFAFLLEKRHIELKMKPKKFFFIIFLSRSEQFFERFWHYTWILVAINW